MNKIRTIIVDDEIDACEGLQLLLSSEPDVDLLSVCRNGGEAIQSIGKLKPDLIFLDIQMPVMNGFEVLDQVAMIHLPFVVFVTAYDEYALDAFEVHALDYLQKPFTDERFSHTLEHARQQIRSRKNTALTALLAAPNAGKGIPGKLKIKASGKIYYFDYHEIIWIEGFDYYIKIHTLERFYLVRESLKNLLHRLPNDFIRIHKSTIINIGHLKALEPLSRGNYEATLSNNKKVQMSKTYRDIHTELF